MLVLVVSPVWAAVATGGAGDLDSIKSDLDRLKADLADVKSQVGQILRLTAATPVPAGPPRCPARRARAWRTRQHLAAMMRP